MIDELSEKIESHEKLMKAKANEVEEHRLQLIELKKQMKVARKNAKKKAGQSMSQSVVPDPLKPEHQKSAETLKRKIHENKHHLQLFIMIEAILMAGMMCFGWNLFQTGDQDFEGLLTLTFCFSIIPALIIGIEWRDLKKHRKELWSLQEKDVIAQIKGNLNKTLKKTILSDQQKIVKEGVTVPKVGAVETK